MAQALEAGMVWVNSENVRHLPTPFGGMKASGIGRDGGDYSFDFYMETKNIAIALDNHKIPKIGRGLNAHAACVKPNFSPRPSMSCAGRKPCSEPLRPPFIRAAMSIGVRDRRAPSMSIASAIWSPKRTRTRSICARSKSAIITRSCCARPSEPSVTALGFKVASEEDLDRAAFWFARKGLPTSFPEMPHQGRTLRTRRSRRHAARSLFPHGSGRDACCANTPTTRARASSASIISTASRPTCRRSYEFYNELGFRLTEYTETDGADAQALGGVDASQGQRARPRLHQRPRPAAASHRRVDGERARHPAHLRRDGVVRLPRQHGARARPARHLERVLSLYPRSRRPPRRAVHLATI